MEDEEKNGRDIKYEEMIGEAVDSLNGNSAQVGRNLGRKNHCKIFKILYLYFLIINEAGRFYLRFPRFCISPEEY